MIIHSLVAIIVPSFLIFKQMVNNILSGQHEDKDQYIDLDPVTQKAKGMTFSLNLTCVAAMITVKHRVDNS